MVNSQHGKGELIAWSKQDPTRTDLDVPLNIRQIFSDYSSVFDRYGKVLYGIYRPTENHQITVKLLKAFLDLMFEERGITPRAGSKQDNENIRAEYFTNLFPKVDSQEVVDLLNTRKYVILEGPPGTGKTRMAMQILNKYYLNNGTTIQFHPNTTYETFLGGLSPEKDSSELGFHFTPKKGDLMEAVVEASKSDGRGYLLHIDEINRAGLSKVLGEAIYLLEPKSEIKRTSSTNLSGEINYSMY
jgi:5-methylcytosine-specific restriction protein B